MLAAFIAMLGEQDLRGLKFGATSSVGPGTRTWKCRSGFEGEFENEKKVAAGLVG